MTYTIHKGHHRPRWWFFRLWPWFRHDVKSVSRKVTFSTSCRYQFKPSFGMGKHPDQNDVNKIFGIGYMWTGKNSARFGWNYNIQTDKINLFAYYHTNSPKGEFDKICEVEIGVTYLLILNIHERSYRFSVITEECEKSIDINRKHKKKLSYNQGLYFGGQQRAPHDITIEINKL